MSDGTLIAMLIIALGVHVALVRVNRRLGAGEGRAPGVRMSALLTRTATAAAIAGWGALALGLVLDAVHVHALSTVLAAAVVLMVPLALLCLSASLPLRFVARSGGLRPAVRRAYRRIWQFIQAVIPLLGAALLALVSLALRVEEEIAKIGIAESADEDKKFTIGAHYNARISRCDNGLDSGGIYEHSPDRIP